MSARYAPGPDSARVEKLLRELAGVPASQRTARFECVLCLASPDGEWWAERGTCEGTVLSEAKGSGGFGYDPVLFVPALGKSMGELTVEEKSRVSHRGKAFAKMQPHLQALLTPDKDEA